MQNLEVKDVILTTKKTKSEIKKELEDSIANCKKNEDLDIEEKRRSAAKAEKMQQKLFTNLKKLLRTKKVTVWLAHHQGKIFQKFRSKERFVSDMVTKFKVRKSTIVFKIALCRLIDEYPKIKNTSFPLHFFKKTLEINERSL